MAVLDADGRLRSVSSGLLAGLGTIAAPRVTIVQARLAGLDATHAASLPAAELVIARTATGDRPVWRVTSALDDGRPVVTRVDALTGEMLEADAGVAHAIGNVWPTDPRGPVEQRDLPVVARPGMVALGSRSATRRNRPSRPIATSAPGDLGLIRSARTGTRSTTPRLHGPIGYPDRPTRS
jgi:hypothetical protein